MKLLVLGLAVVVAVTAWASALVAANQSSPYQGPIYGHVKSIQKTNHRFVMRFDPAWWLTGLAAERACGCKPVSNDYYIVDDSHRLLTFAVRPDARVSVITQHGEGPLGATSISVAELAQIVKGKNPRHRRLLEPKAGFWIRIGVHYPNPVISLDQQYQP